MKIAIVHPWFVASGGAEHTVNVLAETFPDADVVTLLYNEEDLPESVKQRSIQASLINWLPMKYRLYRFLMPLYPLAFESLDLRGYDLIISSDSCMAKGVIIDQHARHICYCHSPMRALWDARYEFRDLLPKPLRPLFRIITHRLRLWDFIAAQRVDIFVANSKNVAQRISRFYRRKSIVIYPPVEVEHQAAARSPQDFYLCVGRLTDTKRVDVLIKACNSLGRKLVIVGQGRQHKALKSIAGPTIEFAGFVGKADLERLYLGARALLFAADEDFGIVPVEAQSYGTPVIAYGHGGTLETVADDRERPEEHTGVYFDEQTPESLCEAILRFEAIQDQFDSEVIRKRALKFSRQRFMDEFKALVEQVSKVPPRDVHFSFGEISTSQESADQLSTGV